MTRCGGSPGKPGQRVHEELPDGRRIVYDFQNCRGCPDCCPCGRCGGSGKVYKYADPENPTAQLMAACPACKGTGVEPKDEKWEGMPGATEHRTLGGRAWCFACSTYCYPPPGYCPCCQEADPDSITLTLTRAEAEALQPCDCEMADLDAWQSAQAKLRAALGEQRP